MAVDWNRIDFGLKKWAMAAGRRTIKIASEAEENEIMATEVEAVDDAG